MSLGGTALILGSASPRRAALLAAAGVAFEIDPADVDETVPDGTAPEVAAELLAQRKARAVAARHEGEDVVVLAADTIVAVPGGNVRGELLAKPVDERDARRMLSTLSGSRHQVVTGVCALHASGGAPALGHETTWVTMRALAPEEIAAYVATGEWRDKAGGYAIQERAEGFVTRLEGGGFDNVVGLPVALALALAEKAARLAGGGRGG